MLRDEDQLGPSIRYQSGIMDAEGLREASDMLQHVPIDRATSHFHCRLRGLLPASSPRRLNNPDDFLFGLRHAPTAFE